MMAFDQDHTDAGGFTLADEVDLRAYFALELPPAPGTRSPLGAMCDRMANGANPKTKELPAPTAPWTEIVDCHPRGVTGAATDAEDAFIAYIDGRRRVARTWAVLSRLPARDRDVLQAHYSDHGGRASARATAVAALTSAARAENRARAAHERHQSVEETIESLSLEMKDTRVTKSSRYRARTQLVTIAREAAALLQHARAAYGRIRTATRR